MQITHEEAHKLIQFSMDRDLKPQERNTLQTHLADCGECRNFAEDLRELGSLLLPAMQKRWSFRPPPLSVEKLQVKRKEQLQISLLVTRMVIICIVFAAFIFSTWQFTHSGPQTVTPMPLNGVVVPTPSGESTNTEISFQNCAEMKYQVQEQDTLESIAAHFSVSKDQIISINNLHSESIRSETELIIPVCAPTSTSTVSPSTQTTTVTPVIGSTTSAPGG